MAILNTSIPGMEPKRGKVRDVYDFGENILLVSTDRISAYDWILPSGIPDKGKVLTRLAEFWFKQLDVKNHLITTDVNEIPFPPETDLANFEGRSTFAKKCEIVPIECVVRGYLSGSGWAEYQKSGTVCGIKLSDGLRESDRLETPIFTPATKAESGHDENISFEQMIEIVGEDTAETLKAASIDIFLKGTEYALKKGIIIADTKFEFGRNSDGELILADEVLTPDSSRFWPADQYEPGKGQPSFDKQFVRDWLSGTAWDKNSPPPALPEDIISKTREKYIEAYEILVGRWE